MALISITNHDVHIPNSRPPRGHTLWEFSVNGTPGVNLGTAKTGSLVGLDGPDDEFFQGCGPKISYRLLVDGYATQDLTKRSRDCPRHRVVSHVVQLVERFIEFTQSLAERPGRLRFGPTFIELEHLYLMKLKKVSTASFQVYLGYQAPVDPQALFNDAMALGPTLYRELVPPQNEAPPVVATSLDDLLFIPNLSYNTGTPMSPFDYNLF